MKSRSLLGWFVRLGVGLGILYYIFTFIPFAEVVATISSTKGTLVAMALTVLILERFTAALRVKILTDRVGMAFPLLTIWEINTISSFYAMFLPGELAGGAVRWYKMSKPRGERAEALAVITFERLVDTIALLVLGIIFWFLDVPPFGSVMLNLVFIGIVGGLVAGLFLSLSRKASALLLKPLDAFPNWSIARFVHEKVGKVLDAVRQFRKLSAGALASLITLTCARHLLSLMIMFYFVRSLDMNVEFVSLGWIRSFMNIVTMLPVSFSGLGVREVSFVLLLEPYGIPGSEAVALSFLVFITHLLLAAAGGLLEAKNTLLPERKGEKTT